MPKNVLFFMVGVGLAVSFLSMGRHLPIAQTQAQAASAANLPFGWARTWGGSLNEIAHNVTVDGAGNIYVAGEYGGQVDFDPGNGITNFTSNGGQDVFLSKFNSNGDFQWVRTWGGIGRDVPNGLVVDASGNVYVSGPFQYTVDFNPDPLVTDLHSSNNVGGANNIFISKFASDGTFQWVRTWGPSDGGAESYSIAMDGSNNVYVVGDFSGTTTNFNPWDSQHPDWHTNHPPTSGPVFFDAFLSKFASDGTFQWAKTWGGEGYDDGPGVTVDGFGNVYVAGMYASKNIDFDPAGGGALFPAHDSGIIVDVFLSKFNSSGTFQWVRTWGGQGTDDVAETVAVDSANNVYVGGRYASINCNFDPWGQADLHSSNGALDAFVSKFSSNGSFQWARTWGGTGADSAGGLAVDVENNLYTTGNFAGTVNFNPAGTANFTSLGGQDVFISEFASDGGFQWAKTWGGSGDDSGYHLALDRLGNLFAVGSFQGTVDMDPGSRTSYYSSNGGSDAFLSKFLSLLHPIYLPLITK